jgi:hypothetical protein
VAWTRGGQRKRSKKASKTRMQQCGPKNQTNKQKSFR